jgi:glyoxylase-like metal-dependent hydrolase (beta-lactamase superfamily II)
MERILPGVLHWTTVHERWGIEISSYLLEEERVLIDPRIPPEGLEWFAEHGPPLAALLTNRHHYRHSGAFAERFGTTVHASRQGMHAFTAGEPVIPFDPGDELPGGVVALEVGGICPDESALLVPAHRALAVADGVMRMPPDGPLRFVSDDLMDDPGETKARLAAAYRRVLERDWDTLLPAHGRPLVAEGRTALAEFVASV